LPLEGAEHRYFLLPQFPQNCDSNPKMSKPSKLSGVWMAIGLRGSNVKLSEVDMAIIVKMVRLEETDRLEMV
jgi:hypothetical protein